ncbi:hypothetical protein GCM10012275_60660 [Longimycelium tulufanense]|uniref:Bacterial mobilisation domain-containing protein n=1 Tax=Longimycelium tulufanense TaxID=907463 RepID=A0A8J3CKT8_9PSEU|nr:plasmid mobilization relaxosome protein MobC [Longimycelium tulufanense]GGM81942.1 hypothetical protein GCM10012275_60660 [Longimycelium tulufanense]
MSAEPTAGKRRGRVPGGRENVVKVRLSDEELVQVRARAVAARMTVPAYLAEAGLQDLRPRQGAALTLPQRRALAAELAGIRRLLSYLGNNINQIATVANATGAVPPEVTGAGEAVARTVARLTDFIADVDPLGRS